jgi:hypothetical protein
VAVGGGGATVQGRVRPVPAREAGFVCEGDGGGGGEVSDDPTREADKAAPAKKISSPQTAPSAAIPHAEGQLATAVAP